ncbi:uncharacterized protein LOC132314968 [Cornus florida]|uniref:uncharacterized protein LOC132314968 n=1 Tax=Cornus florida TaxID=4283 RepID=UPI00289B78DB|nr:uncharacterized protein LOC132314968 [Cornus florida]
MASGLVMSGFTSPRKRIYSTSDAHSSPQSREHDWHHHTCAGKKGSPSSSILCQHKEIHNYMKFDAMVFYGSHGINQTDFMAGGNAISLDLIVSFIWYQSDTF